MNNDGSEKGGYVFISHSHQDIAKVRQIRNTMEEEGYEPLCFYLKCLTDEDEIEGLIKREIDAREWFVYVDSPNARASRWVSKEREYISSLGSKQIITIDLDSAGSMNGVAEKLIRGLRILIVCDDPDLQLAHALRQIFTEKDMQVILKSEEAAEQEGTAAEGAGCIVILMSRSGISAEKVNRLLAEDTNNDSAVVLAITDDYDIGPYEDILKNEYRLVYKIRDTGSKLALEEFVRRVENEVTHDLRKAFAEAASHSEVEGYYIKNSDDPEAAKLAEEAHDRLDEERRIKEDILEHIENGTMQMTDELRKFLES